MSEIRIEYVKIETLIPYQNNARKHSDADTDAIMQSIREFGFNDPIGVWKNIIVEGHGRLIAAKRIGMDEVPVIRLDHLTDEQRKAYALAHNKTAELSGWDFDILAAELKDIADIDMSQFGFEYPEENEGGCGESGRDGAMKEKFLVPPFSVLYGNKGDWLKRKKAWLAMGIKSEAGRGGDLCFSFPNGWRDNHN